MQGWISRSSLGMTCKADKGHKKAFYEYIIIDELRKSQIPAFPVIPAIGACPVLDTGAGIQCFQVLIVSRLRGNDVFGTFYETIKIVELVKSQELVIPA